MHVSDTIQPLNKRDPDGVKANILRAALEEFSEHGLSGARVNVIADKTKTSKRMLYYYFESKEGLYRAVLEDTYAKIRRNEALISVDERDPESAMQKLVELTFEHHKAHPHFIRLVMIENVHHAEHMKHIDVFRALNASAISTVESVYRRGVGMGVFRDGIEPVELHWMISSMCFFNVSNAATFRFAFGESLFDEVGQLRLKRHIVESVMRFLKVSKEAM